MNALAIDKSLCEVALMDWIDLKCEQEGMEGDMLVLSLSN